jgi:hypothetical protein
VIVLRAVRVEDTGEETELGEVRMLEAGAGVYSYLETPTGAGVMRDLRRRLESEPAPEERMRRPKYMRGRLCGWSTDQ